MITSADEMIAGDGEISVDYTEAPKLQMAERTANYVSLIEIDQELTPTTASEFTIVLPAGTYAAGMKFTIETSTGDLSHLTTQKAITIERSKVTPLAPLEVKVITKNFPDAKFRAYLATQGLTLSNPGTPEEDIDINDEANKAKFEGDGAITKIDCFSKDIQSLKGIEHFKKLADLDCGNNNLSALDLTNLTELTMLYCYNNQLAKLDLTSQTQLNYLECYNNRLTMINLRNNQRTIYNMRIGNQADADGNPLSIVAYTSGSQSINTNDPENIRASIDSTSPVPTVR